MKRLFTIILAGLSIFSAVSCLQEKAIFDVSKATAPVLTGSTVGSSDVTATFTPAKFEMGFNENVPVNHFFAVVKADDKVVSRSVISSVSGNEIKAKFSDINNTLYALGCEVGKEITVEMAVRASLQENSKDNGVNGYVDSEGTVSFKFTTTAPAKEVKYVYVLGSFNGWSHNTALHLMDYKDDGTYNGVIDLGEDHSAPIFKITPAPNWNKEWGAPEGMEEEAEETTLLTSGGGNIGAFKAHRYYFFGLESGSGKFFINKYEDEKDETKNFLYAFDQVSLIGTLCGTSWDTDFDMTFDPATQRFYVDVEGLAEGQEVKVRFDHAWAANFGSADGTGMTQDGANMKIEVDGTARVYFNMNNPDDVTLEIVPDDYQATAPIWSLIGTIGGTNWDSDFDMEYHYGVFAYEYTMEIADSEEFKVRLNHDWDINRGLNGSAAAALVEGEATPVKNGGANMKVPESGKWTVSYNPTADTVTITKSE